MQLERPNVRHVSTLTHEGNIAIDISFESMDDFSPDTVAQKVDPLRKLLDARTQLANLLSYMDGKSGAEELIAKVLADPALMKALSSTPNLVEATHESDKP